jgi:preprotein translocase subunit SecY
MLNAPLLTAAVDAFKIPDLRRKLLFTLGMLVTFRFIAHIPVPGADVAALQKVFETNQLAGFFDLFSGGALSSLSVAALGVYPYITAQIIMQIMQPAIPKLQEIAKEGESGRQKINQWTHWLTVPLAMFQAYGTPNLINFSSGGNTPAHRTTRSGSTFPRATHRAAVAQPWEKPSTHNRTLARGTREKTSSCRRSR